MPIHNIRRCSNTFHIYNMDMGSSLKWCTLSRLVLILAGELFYATVTFSFFVVSKSTLS